MGGAFRSYVKAAWLYVMPPLIALVVVFLNAPLPYGIEKAAEIDPQLTQFARLDGVFAPNKEMARAVRYGVDAVRDAEKVMRAPDGSLYAFDEHSQLFRISAVDTVSTYEEPFRAERVHSFGYSNGRPVAGDFLPDGRLVFCNVPRGLFIFDLRTKDFDAIPQQRGVELHFCDDLAVSRNGSRIYVTDAVDYAIEEAHPSILLVSLVAGLEGRASGRVLEYDFASSRMRVVADGFLFANGIALSPDGSFLVVSETYASRVHRIWLDGPKAGVREPFGTSLMPGFLDGISRASDGGYWVAVYASQPVTWPVFAQLPRIRHHAMKIPNYVPGASSHGLIVKLDANGVATKSLHDPRCEQVCLISSVLEHDGKLFFGHVGQSFLSVLSLD
uniref:Strictosidine synthase conserved region domain-containing protein n=1 Tax=Erythrolobus australicus TaxID=1077150 RepID=A0A7S1TP07_9RHOD